MRRGVRDVVTGERAGGIEWSHRENRGGVDADGGAHREPTARYLSPQWRAQLSLSSAINRK